MLVKPTLVLRSPLPPAEAEEALRGVLASPRPWSDLLSKPRADGIFGTIGGGRISLRYRSVMRNSASPVFRGRLLPDGGGSRVEGRFGVPLGSLLVLAFFAYFVLGLASMGVALVVLGDEEPEGGAWKGFLFIGVAIGFALFARFIWFLCRRMAAGEEEALRRFLALHLRVPVAEPGPEGAAPPRP